MTAPAREWQSAASAPIESRTLFYGYVAPLAAIAPLCLFVRESILGLPLGNAVHRVPVLTAILEAAFSFGLSLLAVYLIARAVVGLARPFGGEADETRALELVAYSYTPSWLIGVLLLLPPNPIVSLLALAGSLYGFYLLYLGLPTLLKVSKENALAYTVLIALCAFVLGVALNWIADFVRVGLRLPQ